MRYPDDDELTPDDIDMLRAEAEQHGLRRFFNAIERALQPSPRPGHPADRRVCGKGHATEERARRGLAAAKTNHWQDCQIEPRQGYFVVTGVPPVREPGPTTSMPIRGRYRWSK